MPLLKGSNLEITTDEVDDDVIQMIKDSLTDAFKESSGKNRKHGHVDENGSSKYPDLRIKIEYAGEKRAIQMRRPVKFSLLSAKIKDIWQRPLTMYYTVANSEVKLSTRNKHSKP